MNGKTSLFDCLTGISVYLKQKGVVSITRRGYIFDARQFIEWLGENAIDISEVGKNEAQLYVDFLISRQYLSSTIQKKVSSLRTFFEYLEHTNG